jgi:ribosomal-protein-alanine N-acetyltransferase
MRPRQSKNVNLIQLSPAVLEGLASGNLGREHCGRKTSGADLFRSILAGLDWSNTWRRRVQIVDDPAALPWITRAVVDVNCNVVWSDALDFTCRPTSLEWSRLATRLIRSFVDKATREQPLMRLLLWAKTDPAIRTVRASIRPDNVTSLALVVQFGFGCVGE